MTVILVFAFVSLLVIYLAIAVELAISSYKAFGRLDWDDLLCYIFWLPFIIYMLIKERMKRL